MSDVRLIDANALLEKAEVVMDEHKTMFFDAVSVNNIHNAPTIEQRKPRKWEDWTNIEPEREALMRLTMCARGECPICKYEEKCDDWDFRMELATKNMNILADALTDAFVRKPKHEWIPCEERLPTWDDGVTCLVSVIADDATHTVVCMETPNVKRFYEMNKINAWMPLPEPYREGENNE